MPSIDVHCRDPLKAMLIEDVIWFCMRELLPGIRKLSIDVEVKKLQEGYHGFCHHMDGRDFILTIAKDQTINDLIQFVCHEMVHVKQFVKGEIANKDGKYHWKARPVVDRGYWNDPCEVEAHKLDKKLRDKYLSSRKL